MLTIALWVLAILLEALLLARGLQEKLLRRFPLFYSYILFVLLEDLLRFSVYRWLPNHYSQVYWATQFPALVIGSAVVFEVYRVALRAYPGTARMARNLLFIVFGVIFANSLANSSGSFFWRFVERAEELERNLRIVQAVAIFTLVSVFLWYAIPFGRNLKGILIGYGSFVAVRVVQYVLRYYFWDDIKPFWPHAQAVSYLLVLGIWACALWSAHAVPEVDPAPRLERDYESLVASTRGQFQRALARLGWAARV
jgi:hypothetical protein